MENTLKILALQTVAMMLTAFLLPKFKISGPLPAFMTVLFLAFINTKFWDAALFFSIPTTFGVQPLILLIINGVILLIVAKLLPGIEITGLFAAITAPILFTLINIALVKYAPLIDWDLVARSVKEVFDYLRALVGSTKAQLPQGG